MSVLCHQRGVVMKHFIHKISYLYMVTSYGGSQSGNTGNANSLFLPMWIGLELVLGYSPLTG